MAKQGAARKPLEHAPSSIAGYGGSRFHTTPACDQGANAVHTPTTPGSHIQMPIIRATGSQIQRCARPTEEFFRMPPKPFENTPLLVV